MNPLSNILIKPNVITQKGINFFVDYIKSQKQSDLEIFDAKTSNVQNKNIKNPTWKTDKSVRDTQTVSIDSILPQTHDLLKNVVTNIINQFYNIEIHDSEIPQLLVYNVGGIIIPILMVSLHGPIQIKVLFGEKLQTEIYQLFFI